MATNEYMRNWQHAKTERLNDEALAAWLTADFQEIKVVKGKAGLRGENIQPKVVVGENLPKRRTGYREGGHIKAFARLKKKTTCPGCGKVHSEYNFYTGSKRIEKGIRCKGCKE